MRTIPLVINRNNDEYLVMSPLMRELDGVAFLECILCLPILEFNIEVPPNDKPTIQML